MWMEFGRPSLPIIVVDEWNGMEWNEMKILTRSATIFALCRWSISESRLLSLIRFSSWMRCFTCSTYSTVQLTHHTASVVVITYMAVLRVIVTLVWVP